MQKQLAEHWALQVLESIANHGAYEAGLIELKRESTDTERFARQLAGMANAAQATTVLVLVGVDQQEGVVGAAPFEIGDWYSSTRSHFENGHAPSLVHSTFLPFDEKLVGAFFFETDDAPYVIGRGKKGGQREILWRYGSATGPAGRAELLRLLVPKVETPEVEVQRAEVRFNNEHHASVNLNFFLYPSRSMPSLFIPFHRLRIQASDDSGGATLFSQLPAVTTAGGGASLAKLVGSAVALEGPSLLHVNAAANEVSFSETAAVLHLKLSLLPANFESPVVVGIPISKRDHPDHKGYWELPAHHGNPLDTVDDQLKRLEAMAPKRFQLPFEPLPRPW